MVGLVEHGHLDRVELGVTALHEVLETARAGDDDVDAAGERVDLRRGADATEHGGGAQAHRRGQRGDDRRDLVGQLTGRHEHQAPRTLGLRAPAVRREADDERQGEGDGLARTGTATTEQVASGEGVDQRRLLDGERVVGAALGEEPHQVLGDAELGEGHRGGGELDVGRCAGRTNGTGSGRTVDAQAGLDDHRLSSAAGVGLLRAPGAAAIGIT